MTIKQKTKSQIIGNLVTTGYQVSDSDLIRLTGGSDEAIADTNIPFCPHREHLTPEKVLNVGSIFYYKVEARSNTPLKRDRKPIHWEEGWGRLKRLKDDQDFYLERLDPKRNYSEEAEYVRRSRNLTTFNDQRLLVYTTIPDLEDIFDLHSTVICSQDGHVNPVHLDKGQILANINDNLIGASISEAVSATCNSLDLNSDNSFLSSNSIILKSQKSRPKDVEPGTIIYNSRKKCFEGYDGSKWKALKWED